jgi:RNA-binding protein
MSEKVEEKNESRGQAVIDCSPQLSGAQRRHLRGLGHHLKPVVMIGDKGLHETLIKQIDRALEDHELIKVKARGANPSERSAAARSIHSETGAQVVQIVGRTLLLYREHPETPRIRLPQRGLS